MSVNMRKASGIIFFSSCALFGCIISYFLITDPPTLKDLPLIICVVIGIICGIVYVRLENFGRSAPPILKSLEKEIDLIKKKIENKELMDRLSRLEKK